MTLVYQTEKTDILEQLEKIETQFSDIGFISQEKLRNVYFTQTGEAHGNAFLCGDGTSFSFIDLKIFISNGKNFLFFNNYRIHLSELCSAQERRLPKPPIPRFGLPESSISIGGGGSSDSGSAGDWGTNIVSDLNKAQIRSHYATFLSKNNWKLLESGDSTYLDWSTWKLVLNGGTVWFGTLLIEDFGANKQSIEFRCQMKWTP